MLISIWPNTYINVLPITISACFSFYIAHIKCHLQDHNTPGLFCLFYSLDFSSEIIISLEKSQMLKRQVTEVLVRYKALALSDANMKIFL